MANQLKMARIQAIQQLQALRWSQRRIARELGIDRGTVRRYQLRGCDGSNPATLPSGCEPSKPATVSGLPGPDPCVDGAAEFAEWAALRNRAIPPTGSDAVGESPKPAIVPIGFDATAPASTPRKPAGRPSECEPYREIILARLEQELTA